MPNLKTSGTERGGFGLPGWLRGQREPRPAAPESSRHDAKQRLRLHRFFLASAFSLLYLVVLLVFYRYGKVDGATLLAAVALVGVLIAAFFLAFELRVNLRFRDPSLTAPQVLAAVFTMLFVLYRAPDTRLLFNAFFFVALMFGMLRSSGLQLTLLGGTALAGFGLVSALRHAMSPDAETLATDILQLIVTAIAFPWFVFIGGRVKLLKEADRRKDDFLATLAHELRNPLAPIRTGIQILQLTIDEPPARRVLPMMERQLQHLTRLLDDLLDVSRITRGKVALKVERVDVRHVVEAAVETSRPLIVQMRHALTMSLPATPLELDADPVRLAQIVANLLNNAAKYTPPGGNIGLTARREGDQVELVVADDGIGIPAETMGSIFEMFMQIDGPDTPSGLGIGLALVKGLVALHGGTIEVRSGGRGKGSEFRVRLPVHSSRGPGPSDAPAVSSGVGKQKALVVDDNADAAASLRMLLELMGHDVRVADGGDEAVRIAEEFRPDVVLLDLGMPEVDGYAACRRIRAAPWGRQMRVVAITGWGQDQHRRDAVAAGFDAHLVKPVKPEMLAELFADLRSPSGSSGD